MLKSCLSDDSDAYVLVRGTISIEAQAGYNPNNGDKDVVFKNWTPFPGCLSEIDNTQIDNAKDIDVVIPMYNLIEYSDYYTKISGTLWQYYRDEPALTNAGAIANFDAADNSFSFKFKQKITGKTDAVTGRKDVEIMVPLKYLSNFWRTLEMLLIDCEINLILTWFDKWVLSTDKKATTFAIADTKFYVLVVTLST